MAIDWDRIRSEFPALANWTFLNTATYGQLPECSTNAVMRHFSHRDELACSDFLQWFDDMDRIRELAGRLVNCPAGDIAFIPNAATALSLLLSGLEWKAGDRIVTLESEFPNNIYYSALLAEQGVEFVETPWDRFFESITARTRAVVISTVNYTNGFMPPLVRIARFLRERGVLLYVDGTQSVGALQFDIDEVQPDMLAVHGYKWLLSPNGAGFMYVRPDLRKRLRPGVIGWRSHEGWRDVDQLHHGAPVFKDAAEKYEGGMLNFPSLYAMGASIEMMLEIGPEAIERRVSGLADLACRMLRDAGAEIIHEGSPIIAARFAGRDAGKMVRELKERRILVSARHGNLRVSVHFYNNEADLQILCDSL